MLTILHGDDTEKSRAQLNSLRQSSDGKEIRHIDGKSLDLNGLTQALQSGSMFGGDLLVIVERFFVTLGRKIKQIGAYAVLLSEASSSTDIIVWEDKELSPGTLKGFGPKASIRLFKTPVVIFQFLDNLKPRNSKFLLTVFESLVELDAPELIFVMIVRRIRQLIMLADHVLPDGMKPWQATRLTNQAKFFTMRELQTMEKQLLAIEYSIKSGQTPLPLKTHLEKFLIDL
jgi:DNA polymerase III delta subunit